MTVLLMIISMLNFGNYAAECRTARDGGEICFHFFGHASIAVEYDGKTVYIDPVGSEADYAKLPKADVILVTHAHSDHFDETAIAQIAEAKTVTVCNAEVGKSLERAIVMHNGERKQITSWLTVEAVPAYNVERKQYHPKGRDNGYILSVGGERIYVAGDTEFTPEMAEIKDIDYLFLPVNLPYTMTVKQASLAAAKLSPRVFFPYHTVGTRPAELEKLTALPKEIEVVIHPMD